MVLPTPPVWAPPGATKRTLGVDVSRYQPNIDWSQVRSDGIRIAYCKATEGQTYKSPPYSVQMHGAEGAGLRVGWYHFYRPKGDPAAEAQWALSEAGWVKTWLPPMLDVEVTDGVSPVDIVAGMKVWLELVEARAGVPPIIYTSPGFWREIGNPMGFTHYPLWVAHYAVSKPRIPDGWTAPVAWQFTSSGMVKGIRGPVDLNLWFQPREEV